MDAKTLEEEEKTDASWEDTGEGAQVPESHEVELSSLEEQLTEAIQRRDNEQLKRLHEELVKDPAYECNGQVMRDAVIEGNDVFVVWQLTHCGAAVPEWLVSLAVTHGRVEVLKHLLSSGYAAEVIIKRAVVEGSLDVVQRLNEAVEDEWKTSAMDEAATHGRLDVVQWLHTNRTEGCTTRAMDGAAEKGHLAVVQWLHANRSEGCTTEAMDTAAWFGHLDVV